MHECVEIDNGGSDNVIFTESKEKIINTRKNYDFELSQNTHSYLDIIWFFIVYGQRFLNSYHRLACC